MPTYAIQFGQQRDVGTNFGDGPDVNVTYSSGSPLLIVDPITGVVHPANDVVSKTPVSIIATGTGPRAGLNSTILFDVWPQATSQAIINASTDNNTFTAIVGPSTIVSTTTLSIDSSSNGLLFISWTGLDITSLVSGVAPLSLMLHINGQYMGGLMDPVSGGNIVGHPNNPNLGSTGNAILELSTLSPTPALPNGTYTASLATQSVTYP